MAPPHLDAKLGSGWLSLGFRTWRGLSALAVTLWLSVPAAQPEALLQFQGLSSTKIHSPGMPPRSFNSQRTDSKENGMQWSQMFYPSMWSLSRTFPGGLMVITLLPVQAVQVRWPLSEELRFPTCRGNMAKGQTKNSNHQWVTVNDGVDSWMRRLHSWDRFAFRIIHFSDYSSIYPFLWLLKDLSEYLSL